MRNPTSKRAIELPSQRTGEKTKKEIVKLKFLVFNQWDNEPMWTIIRAVNWVNYPRSIPFKNNLSDKSGVIALIKDNFGCIRGNQSPERGRKEEN